MAGRRITSFSRYSSWIRLRASCNSDASSQVIPGRIPSSTSAWRIQFVKQDSEIPESFAITESY